MDINNWLAIILLLTLQTHFVFTAVLHGKNSLKTVDGVNSSAEALARRQVIMKDNFQTYQKTCDRRSMSNDLPERAIMKSEIGVDVICDTKTDGGGWIMIQRRISFDVDFNKRWLHYRNGFGSSAGDFWLGLKHMHNLTKNGTWELRIDMRYKNVNYYAQYRSFKIGSESEYFPLRVSGFSGNVKDELKRHNGYRFYTIDYPGTTQCAAKYLAGWWFHNCHDVFLNGEQPRRKWARGIHWYSLTDDNSNLQSVEMKIRKQ
ncbi:ficolin-1-like [Physella acuta]|uniref:ficolin-1-like n=1 Tax=Physella acuta TaxID=109671 RepID=UPI0027DDAF4B|nr:ficolin-1-like [Physella acuta]